MKQKYIIMAIVLIGVVALIGFSSTLSFVAEDYDLKDSLDVNNWDVFEPGAVWATEMKGQTFVAGSSYSLYGVRLKIKPNSNPSGIVTVSVTGTTNNLPDDNKIYATTTRATNEIGDIGWKWFEFSQSVNIIQGTKYAITISCSGSLGANGIQLAYICVRNAFTSGDAVVKYSSRSYWEYTNNVGWEDFAFETYTLKTSGPEQPPTEPEQPENPGDETPGQSTSSIPGFELVIFLGAIFVAFLILKRKK